MTDLLDLARRRAEIQRLNDEFRSTFFMGEVCITQGALAFRGVHEVLDLVRNYTDFNEQNDPYGEHDFGAISFRGAGFFWKSTTTTSEWTKTARTLPILTKRRG